MKELIELHEKILASGIDSYAEHPVNFSRVEIEDEDDLLSVELMDELKALQSRINPCLPEGVDYFAFVGGTEAPVFDLTIDNALVGRDNQSLAPVESLFSQLQGLDWDALREKAAARFRQMETFLQMMQVTNRAPRSTKQTQKDFKEIMQGYIRKNRADASRIYLLWHSQEDGKFRTNQFSTAEELRETLPRILFGRGEVITIIAFGKPLAVEKIDALMSEAHRKTKPMLQEALTREEQREIATADGVIDV